VSRPKSAAVKDIDIAGIFGQKYLYQYRSWRCQPTTSTHTAIHNSNGSLHNSATVTNILISRVSNRQRPLSATQRLLSALVV